MSLYEDAGWGAYTHDSVNLAEAVKNSYYVLTAWDGDHLIGMMRVVGDGVTISYIQDILVKKKYKRRKIGTKLLTKTLEHFKNVRQTVLLTDNKEETVGFYKAMGFEDCKEMGLISFARINRS
ncbi:MAG: GNAT family N-acetyltransferase [Ignavibacteria bacterium]|jgi:ribosomal protein S18 acetylase RimI-like enzyme|nr:GNAT family N-acetyltransferase [Ignavibacteria bacterium]